MALAVTTDLTNFTDAEIVTGWVAVYNHPHPGHMRVARSNT